MKRGDDAAESRIAEWRGKWALVTGASAGIGAAIAEELSLGGAHLVLTARRRERLERLAAELRARNGTQVEVVVADLERPEAPDVIFAFTEGRRIEVELLVNDAGYGTYGEFSGLDLARELGMLHVNCRAVVHLTRLYLDGMQKRGRGDILILASTAAFQPVPYSAVYAASKAFDLHFAEALAQEVARHGVRVCALCPGPTLSEFHEVAGAPAHRSRFIETSRKVARVGLLALASGRHAVVSGTWNRLGAHAVRFVSRRTVTGAAARIYGPKHLR